MRETTPVISHNELARSAMERCQLYELLATAFRREPSAEFLCHLKSPELAAAFADLDIDLGYEFDKEKFVELRRKECQKNPKLSQEKYCSMCGMFCVFKNYQYKKGNNK